ncbi:MAG: HNH endonuclease [Methanosarcinales archaeon]|jgi:hypothetical protein|nr:HNH endonuclease [Methanosarcinales archaeon]
MEVNSIAFTKETKQKIFDNAGGKCQKCDKQLSRENHQEGQRGAWDAHHKTSVASGGKDIASNGKALCLKCHKETPTYGRR